MKANVFLAATLLVLGPGAGSGQRVGGQVLARQTGQPIASALVQLVARDSTVLNTVFTDDAGRFTLAADGCGPVDGFLYVASLGYASVRSSLRDLPIDCSAWSIALEIDPVDLPGVNVRVTRNRGLARVGFYDRQRIGMGTFITRDVIEDRYRTANQVAEIIRQVPGVFRVEQGENEAAVILRNVPTFAGPCYAVFFIDGLPYQNVLPRLPAMDIEAIEVYRGPAQVPAQYSGAYAACGVVLIWTRTGGEWQI